MNKINSDFFEIISSYTDKGLRDYQAHHKWDIYNKWKKVKSILLQMPTGTGKTRLFVSMINDFKRYGEENETKVNVLIITHRKELVEQIKNELFWNYEIKSTLITADNKDSHCNPLPVCIASIQTLQRRLETFWKNYPFNFLIVDEAHHSKARTYIKILEAYPNTKVLGVTATPYRLNGEGFTNEYEELILSPSVKSYIEAGWLGNYDYYSIEEDSDIFQGLNNIPLDKYGEYATTPLWNYISHDRIRAEIVGSYLKYAKGKKAIIYTINRAHNKQLCKEFRLCGVLACDIDSETSNEERKRIVQDFRKGKIDVLCNVDIFTEGFDCPDVEVIQLARPTRSLGLYLQQVGRGLRIANGKRKVIFLDNVGLHNRFGFPASKRMWKKHFLGKTIDESTRFVSQNDKDEPFEMGKRNFDLSEGCEKMILITSTGINKIVEESKIDFQAEKAKRLKQIVKAVFETNKQVYDEFVVGYSELYISYSSKLTDDIVNPCTHIYGVCENFLFWKEKIKEQFKPKIKGRNIIYESYVDLDDYINTKCQMILSRFCSELSKSRSVYFQQLDDYTAEELYVFFAEEYGGNNTTTKKLKAFCMFGYEDLRWDKLVELWESIEKISGKHENGNIKSTDNKYINTVDVNGKNRHAIIGDRLLYRSRFCKVVKTDKKNKRLIVEYQDGTQDNILDDKSNYSFCHSDNEISIGVKIKYKGRRCKVIKVDNENGRLIVKYDDGKLDNIQNDTSVYTLL